jgi:hypothetical protein
MSSLLITVKSKKEEAFVNELLTKLGVTTHRLSIEDREDLGLAILMKQADRRKKVSESEIMKKLHG